MSELTDVAGNSIPEITDVLPIIEDLIRLTHVLAKELGRLSNRAGGLMGSPGDGPEIGILAAELTELLVRTRELTPTVDDVV